MRTWWRSSNMTGLQVKFLPDVRISREFNMASPEVDYGLVYSSACKHETNAIPTAIQRRLWSSDTIELHENSSWRLVALWHHCCLKGHCYKLFHVHFWLFDTMFYSRLTLTLDIVYTCPVVWLDPENMCLTIGILLLPCAPVEICATAYVLPVSGSHFLFTTISDIGEHLH